MNQGDCEHTNFRARVEVSRITKSETDLSVIGYYADVRIHCIECELPFEFIGLPMGLGPTEPRTSVDCLEARMPIKPKGSSILHYFPGFTILRKI